MNATRVYAPGSEEHEDANKLDFDEFQSALDADHAAGKQRKIDFHNEVWPAMVEAVRHVFIASLDGMSAEKTGGHCFELFGLDFMLDERGSPVGAMGGGGLRADPHTLAYFLVRLSSPIIMRDCDLSTRRPMA